MKKILITGAKGQLGRALNNVLMQEDIFIILNTDLNDSFDYKLGNIIKLDIADYDMVSKVVTDFKPDVIINCAAHTAVDLCETDQENAYKINVIGPKNLAIVAHKLSSKLVQISTDYVFDGISSVPYTEDVQGNPQSVYARTKYEAEKNVMHYNSNNIIIRTAWMYGEGKNFVKTMLKLAETNSSIKVINNQFGTPTSADIVAKMIIYLIRRDDTYGIYHGTCEGSTNWYDFAIEIFRLAKKNINVIPIKSSEFPAVAKRPSYSILENKRLKEETDFQFTEWKDELKKYIITLKLS